MIPQETLKELTFLRNRVADLEAELGEIKARRANAVAAIHQHYGLSVGQSRMLAALSEGGVLSRDQLQWALDNPEGDPRLVDTTIRRLRQAAPLLVILTHYGFGYELAPESLAAVRAAIRRGNT